MKNYREIAQLTKNQFTEYQKSISNEILDVLYEEFLFLLRVKLGEEELNKLGMIEIPYELIITSLFAMFDKIYREGKIDKTDIQEAITDFISSCFSTFPNLDAKPKFKKQMEISETMIACLRAVTFPLIYSISLRNKNERFN